MKINNQSFLKQFKDNYHYYIDKNAISIINGQSINYRELYERIEIVEKFLKPFDQNTRFLLCVANPLDYLILSFVLVERQTLIFEDYDFFEEKYKSTLINAEVDFVLCDSLTHPIVRAVNESNVGFYLFHANGYHFEKIKDCTCKYQKSETQISYVIQTSGTTSKPKIFEVNYRAYLARDQFVDFNDQTRYIQLAKMSRVLTITSSIRVIANMGEVILLNYFNPSAIIHYLKLKSVTYISGPPAVWTYLNDYLNREDIFIEQQNGYLLTIGSAINDAILTNLSKRLNAEVVNSYGLTETGIISTTYQCKAIKGSVGKVYLPYKIEDGEVCVSGPTVIGEYMHHESIENFNDGWFLTGDLGYIDENGYLILIGRKKEMINRGGEKVSPFEIEAILSHFSKINEVVVFPYTNKNGFDEVACAVTLKENETMSLNEVRSFLHNKVATFKLPTVLAVLEEMPYHTSYKVKRNQFYEEIKAYARFEFI